MSTTRQADCTDQEIIESVRDTLGQPFTENLRASVEARTSRPTRGFGPEHFSTMDWRADRINLIVDEGQIIVDIKFG